MIFPSILPLVDSHAAGWGSPAQHQRWPVLPPGCDAIASPVSGSVWRIPVAAGQQVKAGETVVIVESMKMEMQVSAPADGMVVEMRCAEGRAVTTGQTLVVFRPE